MRNIDALIRRNAEACWLAKRPQCKCLCGGLYHKKQHPTEWIEQQIKDLSTDESSEAQHELDFG